MVAVIDKLDEMLAVLRQRPADARLDQLEARVWARIDASHRSSWSSALGFRAGLAGMILGVGIAAGGATSATAASEVSPFALHSAFAPSTLLEGRR